MKRILFILTVIISLNSCEQPPYLHRGDYPSHVPRKLVFFTGLDETLCIIDPDGEVIYNNIAETETAPNHLLLRGKELFVTNSLSNSIQVFTCLDDGLYLTDRIYLGKNSNPWMIIPVGGDSAKAYVPCFVSGEIAIIDLETKEELDADPASPEIDRIPAGSGPEGGCVVGNYLYVGNTAWSTDIFGFDRGSVTIVDISTDQVVKTLWIDTEETGGKGANPQSIVPFPDQNEVHVICTGVQGDNDGRIIVVDTITKEVKAGVAPIRIGGSPGWVGEAVNSRDKTVYLTGVKGLQAYNYLSREIYGTDSGQGYYIWEGRNTIMDFFAGVSYDSSRDCLFVCRFNDNNIIIIEKKDKTKAESEYIKIGEMETFNGPQGNILELP